MKRETEGAAWLVAAYAKEPTIPAGFIKLHWDHRGGGGLEVQWWCVWGVRGKRAVKTKHNLEHLCNLRGENERSESDAKLNVLFLVLLFPPFFPSLQREGFAC